MLALSSLMRDGSGIREAEELIVEAFSIYAKKCRLPEHATRSILLASEAFKSRGLLFVGPRHSQCTAPEWGLSSLHLC